jgi:signal transduction histidine kinase
MGRAGEKAIKILVAGNGAGFEPAKLQAVEGRTGSFGLFSMRERLASLGGRMEVASDPGRRSHVTLIVPMGRLKTELALGSIHTA